MAFSMFYFSIAVYSLVLCNSAGTFDDTGLNFVFPNASTPESFNISVDPRFIEQTLTKVKQYRPTIDISTQWTNEGPARANITHLATYWAEDYNWFDIQSQINSNFSHYATTLPGSHAYPHPIPLHFIHQRSSNPDAVPLLLLHGWPSSHLEWSKTISPLTTTNPANLSFHIIAPDLPAFGFSPPPTHPGLGPLEMGTAFNALMQQLNYTSYGLVSTDLGWAVANAMCADAAILNDSTIMAHFTGFFPVSPNATDLSRFAANQTSPEETAYIAAANAWATNHSAYSAVQAQKPLALGIAMSDSPVGFAGWVWDLVWSDGYVWTETEVITTAMMLFVQGTYGSFRAYLEVGRENGFSVPKTDVPTGVSEWDRLLSPDQSLVGFPMTPRSWIEGTTNVVWFSRHGFGGYFPAMTFPDVWVEDVRSFFGQIVGGGA